jgi:hypothetical protein
MNKISRFDKSCSCEFSHLPRGPWQFWIWGDRRTLSKKVTEQKKLSFFILFENFNIFLSYIFVYDRVFLHANPIFCEKVGNSENHRKKFKMDNVKKEKVSGFYQPLFRANLTADQIWLVDFLCCAIGAQHFWGAWAQIQDSWGFSASA